MGDVTERISRRKGITRRWMVNGLGLIVTILVLFEAVAIIAIRLNAFNNVENILSAKANMQANSLERLTSFDFSVDAKEMVEWFDEKPRMEFQVLRPGGEIAFSSSGFTPASSPDGIPPPDYTAAAASDDGKGIWRGESSGGESVMALCKLLYDRNGRLVGALRYVVSLALIERQILVTILLLLLSGVLIVFFVMLSGSYFINSIVNPITELGRTARKIALGDYHIRIEKKYDDEIGDLCDTIQYMAGEIAAAETIKNDFISLISHELRTPLTAIKGWSETLRQLPPEDAPMLERGLSVISGESERLSSIVEDLLDFSRLQSGRLQMTFSRLDLLAELTEAVALFRDRARRSGIELQFVETPDLSPVYGDGDRLKQVFINIIDNAIKYSDTGGRIRVEAAEIGQNVQVVVSDTGLGIAPEDLPLIKDKFVKANHSRPGSGIGLALADEIVRRHRGRIDIESQQDVGTTVTVTLPIAAAAEL